MKQLQLTDFLSYQPLSRLNYAPGGKRAAFVVTSVSECRGGYDQHIWLYEQGETRLLTAMGKEGSFFWEDEYHLLFPSCRTEAEKKRAESGDWFTPFYRIDVRGGEAQPAFTVPFKATDFKPLGDGRFAMLGSIDAELPDAYLLDEAGRKQVLEDKKENADYIVADEIPFWFNGVGDINKLRHALFLVNADGSAKRLSAPLADVSSFAVKDGKIYFAAEERAQKLTQHESIYYWNGRRVCTAWRNTKQWYLSGIAAGLGGIVVLAADGKGYDDHQNPFFYMLNPEKKSLDLLAENTDGIGNSVGGDCNFGGTRTVKGGCENFWFVKTVGGASHLCALNAKGELSVVCGKEGALTDFDVNCRGEALVIGQYDMRISELYAVKDGEPQQITHFNDAVLADKYVAACEPLSIESQGWTIDGWVLKPKDFDEKKHYPAVLDIHGGPKTVYGPVFFHEMQLWANRGYFVFFCNPYGGDGKGNEFADMRGNYGTTDYANLMDFTDAVLAKYPQIDSKRVAVTGGSYGGFMTNWIIGHTDRFACAATQRSISNWVSFAGTSDIGPTFGLNQTAATLPDGIEKIWNASPLKYADKICTPTLFIHSDEDYRCPLEQGLQLFSYLCDHGVPTRIVRFKGENHELSRGGKPKHRVRRLEEITAWIEKYTK